MTDEEALKEIGRQEKRFAAAKCGRGLQLAKSAREYYQTIVKCRQKSAHNAGGVGLSRPSVYDILHNFVAIVSLVLSRYDILQNVVGLQGPGTTDRLTSDIMRGGFVTVDPSVRRPRRPVARRLIPGHKGSRALIRSLADPVLTGFVTKM